MKQQQLCAISSTRKNVNTRRSAAAIGVGMLGLFLTLLVVQAATYGQSLPAAPAGVDEWPPLGGPTAEGGQINGLAVHPTIPDTVYAAAAPVNTYDTGPSTIYKTTNGAASWTPLYVADHQVYALAVTGTHVYAGAFNPGGQGDSIYVSQDSGATWSPTHSTNGRGVWLDIAVSSPDPDVAIIGGWSRPDGENVDLGLVYTTDDGGLTWSPALTITAGEDSAINAVLIHPANPNLWLAAARVGYSSDSVIYRSEDGGATWPITFTITGTHAMSLAAHPSDPDVLYAGTGNNQQGGAWGPQKVFRSSDAGLTWEESTAATGGLLAVEPPDTVYVLGNGVWASPDGGDHWELRQGHVPGPQNVFAIDVGATPVALYMGGGFSGIAKSTNGGVDWSGVNAGIETLVTPRDIAVDPQNRNKLFVAGECAGAGGWLSADGGESWTAPTGLDGCIMAFTVNPHEPDVVYAGAMNPFIGAVRRSTNGGLAFTTVYTAPYILPDGSGGQQSILDVAIADSNPETVYAVGWDSPAHQGSSAVALRSLDDGVSWTEVFTLPVQSWVYVLAIHPRDDSVVYIGGEDCHTGPGCHGFIYRTIDGGENWELTLAVSDTVKSIVIDSLQPNDVYMADEVYWVRKSTDGGDNWAVIRSPHWISGEPSGNKLAVDPYLSGHVFLGGWGYIAETRDGGATWSAWGDPLNNGTPPMEPRALVVDYGMDTQTLYAGFSGVWAHTRVGPLPEQVYLPVVINDAP
jgi:photosystem II stability/assembly factor-like uncharacterized protein